MISLYKTFIIISNNKEVFKSELEKNDISYQFINSVKEIDRERFILVTDITDYKEHKNIIKDNPVIVIGETSHDDETAFYNFSENTDIKLIVKTIKIALTHLTNQIHIQRIEQEYDSQKQKLYQIQKIGIALSSEKDIDKLLGLILQKSRQITNADAGSLYLLETDKEGNKLLRAKLSQNDSIEIESKEFSVQVNDKSLAGYVALTGEPINISDVYEMDQSKYGFSFNRDFDKTIGYRCKSMIIVAMKNKADEVLGVIQLINKRTEDYKDPIRRDIPNIEESILPFTSEDRNILSTFTSQAAVVYENTLLYENIKKLFEGFIKASVTAIESRDPTTSGHSERVALYTVALAEAVNRTKTGKYADVVFNDEQLRELRYASLLHDFGKIGVKESVLVKEKKLYPGQLENIEERFKYISRSIELEDIKKRMDFLLNNGDKEYEKKISEFNKKLKDKLNKLSDYLEIIKAANNPTPLPEEQSDILNEIRDNKYIDIDGETRNYLTDEETKLLFIRKGTLDKEERKEIESHVTHSYYILSQIPWTKDLLNVPEIAYGHHEKLTGKGYPLGKKAEDLPLQARMMAIADIYDALTAKDRPYKKAMPQEKALKILGFEVKDGNLDAELFRIFVEEEVYKKACVE